MILVVTLFVVGAEAVRETVCVVKWILNELFFVPKIIDKESDLLFANVTGVWFFRYSDT